MTKMDPQLYSRISRSEPLVRQRGAGEGKNLELPIARLGRMGEILPHGPDGGVKGRYRMQKDVILLFSVLHLFSFLLNSWIPHHARRQDAPCYSKLTLVHRAVAQSLCSDCFIELLIFSTSRASKFFLSTTFTLSEKSFTRYHASLAISKTLVFLLCNITESTNLIVTTVQNVCQSPCRRGSPGQLCNYGHQCH